MKFFTQILKAAEVGALSQPGHGTPEAQGIRDLTQTSQQRQLRGADLSIVNQYSYVEQTDCFLQAHLSFFAGRIYTYKSTLSVPLCIYKKSTNT